MQIARKLGVLGAVISIAFGLGGTAARAEYPDHPINFIVPWGPGGGADILARTAGKTRCRGFRCVGARCSTCRERPA